MFRKTLKAKQHKKYDNLLITRISSKQKYHPKQIKYSQPAPIQLVNKFFDLQQPCPQEIKNCEEIRQNYIKKLHDHTQHFKGCSDCDKQFIKTYYISQLHLVN